MATEQEATMDEIENDEASESTLFAEDVPDEDIEVVVEDDVDVDGEEAAPEAEEAAPEAEEAAPEAEEAAEGGAEGEDEDWMESASPKLKKRWEREKRLRNQIIQERDQLRNVATQAVGVLKTKDTEILTLRKQYATVQKQYTDTLEFAYDQSIKMKSQELRRARDDGDYDAEQKIQDELMTLKLSQDKVREVRRTLPDPDKIVAPAPQAQPQAQSQPQTQPQRRPPPPLAVKWITKNKEWFTNPKFKAHKQFVLSVDNALVNEGYDPQSAEYYKELDTRIDGAFPTLRKKAKTTTTSPPVGAVGATGTQRPAARRGTIKLNKEDLANMRRFNLDPSNKEHLREYARNKRTAA